MKLSFIYLIFLALVLSILASCQSEYDQIEIQPYPVNPAQVQVVQGLASIEVAITSEWATATNGLQTAVTTLIQTPTEANLAAARQAWRKARDPWERNESFSFGPVSTAGLDAASDTWPIDLATLTQVISTTSVPLTRDYIVQLSPAAKGFHAIEWLLFGQTGAKTLAQFSPREWQLLALLAADLTTQATTLAQNWSVSTVGNFYNQYVTAGQGSATYGKPTDALGEVLNSIVNIMTELPDSKMEKPLSTQSSLYAESRFADYSLTDYRNNIAGVYATYVGQYGSVTASKSLSDLVAAVRPATDEKVRTQCRLCLALLDLIAPTTFNQAITGKTSQLRELQTELRKLNLLLNSEVKPLLGVD